MNDEYIKTLTHRENLVFLKLFCKMVRADGNVDPEEINFLKQIATRYGIKNEEMLDIIRSTANINVTSEAALITKRQNALQLIKELCILANIDNDLHDNELDIIIDAAHAMNIEDDKIVLINRWVLDSFIVAKTGEIIMEEKND